MMNKIVIENSCDRHVYGIREQPAGGLGIAGPVAKRRQRPRRVKLVTHEAV